MAIIKFYYSSKEDAANWLRQFLRYQNNQSNVFQKFHQIFADEIFKKIDLLEKKEALDKLEKWLINKINPVNKKQSINKIKKLWQTKESVVVNSLEKVTERPLYTNKFKASFTSFGLCPYNSQNDWFMISLNYDYDQQLTMLVHELLHLQFEHYYSSIKDKLSDKQYFDLKEAMTVILNVEPFDNFLLFKDRGYQEHKNLRKRILALWLKRENFFNFVEQSVKLINSI